MNGKKPDDEKARHWERTIHEATRSGISILEFCRQRSLQKSQFYWWRRRLKARRPQRTFRKQNKGQASFALVSDKPELMDAGIELVLVGGRRLRISKGVDETTLRTVLSAMGSDEC
jgi:hypothetical protein